MKLFLGGILFFVVLSFAPPALGSPDWTNLGPDSNFDNPANWINSSGVGAVPGPNDSAHIFPGFTVTTSNLLVEAGGPVTININAAAGESVESILVSSNFDGTTVSGGTLNLIVSGTLTVGADAATNTGVIVTGGSTVNYTGNLTMPNGNFVVGTTASFLDSGQVTGPGTVMLHSGSVNLDSATSTSLIVGQGAIGTVVQNSGSNVTTGQNLDIGLGATGTYTVNTGATLNIGTQGTPQSSSYAVVIGTSGPGSTLSISGGTLNAMNDGTIIDVGNGGTGIITQNGAVNLGGASSGLFMGLTGGAGTYQLQSGAIAIGANGTDTTEVDLGFEASTTGTLTQTGGTLIAGAATTVIIGDAGTGSYNLSGPSNVTADFQNGFIVGNQAGSIGTVTQSGGTLTAENLVGIGSGGTGIYNLEGGTATFSASVAVGATGTITQTGGTLIIPSGQDIDLSTPGGAYNLNGGVLQVGNDGLFGSSGEGALNLGGGILQITSAGAFTDPLDGALTGVTTIDAATTPGVTSVTMGGNYNGTGGITFEGSAGTVFSFAGTNSYRGPTTITSGILDANANDISSSSALNIGSAGVLNLTLNAGGFAYAGSIGGSGPLNVNFNTAGDPFVVLNTSSYTGPITLGANGTQGTLQVFSGTFGNIGDNGTASSVVIGGTTLASFPGGTVVPGTGAVTFGNTTYTGSTLINPNFTLNANSLIGSVTNNGSFFALSSGSITNNGTLGLLTGSPVGSTLAINGTLNSTGTLFVNANGTAADSFTATTATLSGVVKVVGTGNNTYTIVTTTGGITIGGNGLVNNAGGLTANTGSPLFSATLAPVPFVNGGLTLQVETSQGTFAQGVASGNVPALTPNQAAVARTLDPIIANGNPYPAAFLPLLTAFNQLPGASIPVALEQLTPESLQYARNIAFENSTFLAQRMNGVDADLRSGFGGLDTSAISLANPGFESGLGRSLSNLLASDAPFHQAAPNGVNYYPGGALGGPASESTSSDSPGSAATTTEPAWNPSSQVISDNPNPYMATQNPSGPEAPKMNEFISGDAVLADLNQDQSAANAPSTKAHYTAGDATAGVSFRMANHFVAGVLFDYNHTDAKTDSYGSKTTVDTYSPGLFATYFEKGFYANGLFSFGYNNYSNSRSIPVVAETASSSPHGQQYVGDLDTGYDFHPDKAWVVGPTLGATYTHLDVDSFTETGAPGADLAVQSQSVDSLRGRLGGHVIYQTNTGDVLLQPNFTAMWQHEFMADSSGITSSFTDFNSTPFTIQTAAPSRDSALIGLGMTATLNNSMALYLNYLADLGASDYFAQSVYGGLKARF